MKVKPKIIVPDISDTVIEIPDEKIKGLRKECTTKTTIFGREKPRKDPIPCDKLVDEYIDVCVRIDLEHSGKTVEYTWEEVKD